MTRFSLVSLGVVFLSAIFLVSGKIVPIIFAVEKTSATAPIAPQITNPFTRTTEGSQTKFLTSIPTSTISGMVNADNWNEFTKQKYQEVEKYRLQVQQEIAQKRKILDQQRKACADQNVSFIKQRAEQRKQVLQGCTPQSLTKDAIAAQMAATGASKSAVLANDKLARLDCYNKLKTFDKETQADIKSIHSACFQTERQVLGLSTEVSQ